MCSASSTILETKTEQVEGFRLAVRKGEEPHDGVHIRPRGGAQMLAMSEGDPQQLVLETSRQRRAEGVDPSQRPWSLLAKLGTRRDKQTNQQKNGEHTWNCLVQAVSRYDFLETFLFQWTVSLWCLFFSVMKFWGECTLWILFYRVRKNTWAGKIGKRCAWRPLDGTPSLLDNFNALDFCHHKRQRTKCKECGGSEICAHQRVRYQCRLCKRVQPKLLSVKRNDSAAAMPCILCWTNSAGRTNCRDVIINACVVMWVFEHRLYEKLQRLVLTKLGGCWWFTWVWTY